jgi:hypothetical protein
MGRDLAAVGVNGFPGSLQLPQAHLKRFARGCFRKDPRSFAKQLLTVGCCGLK